MKNHIDKHKKPKIGYLCSYFPYELADSLGFESVSINELTISTEGKNDLLPVNMCSYIRYSQKILDELDLDGIVLTNCCNGMQRFFDYIKIKRKDLYCYLLEVPRSKSSKDKSFFTHNLKKTFNDMCSHFSISYDDNILETAIEGNKNNREVREGSIYVLGSAASPIMRQKLMEYLKPYNVNMNMCGERRNWEITPCARMENFIEWFENFALENKNKLVGMIYLSAQHCDSFLFNYPIIKKICSKYRIPLLGLEENYRFSGFEQITTRLEAFLESVSFYEVKKLYTYEGRIRDKKEKINVFKQRMNLVKGIIPNLPLRAIKEVVTNQIDIFTKKIWEEPHKIIWTNMVMTTEIFYAVGLVPVNMELVAGWLASLGLSREYIAKSESLGFSPSLCSYHKATLGVIEDGGLPIPKGAAITSHICDGGAGVVNYLSKNYNTDTFVINIPFENKENNLQYVISQYKEIAKWVENYSGKCLSQEKLIEAMELSNIAREYWIKAFELRKGKTLFPGHLSLRNLFGVTFLFGSQLGVDIAKSYYYQLKELSEKEKNKIDKKKRILWIHFAPLYNNRIMEYLESELGCSIVMDITGHIYWDKYDVSKPLESMAKRSLSHFYLGDPEERKKLYSRLINEYKVDGIIHFIHTGCRAISGSSWLVRDVARDCGVPYMELMGDCIDPRGFSEEQMKLRMEAFKETLGRDDFVSRS